jgi:outer membrane protein assembly factor BamB
VTVQQDSTTESTSPNRNRSRLPIGVFIAAFIAALALIGGWIVSQYDHAFGNLAIAIGMLISFIVLYISVIINRSYPRLVRAIIAITPVLAIFGFTKLFRFDGFSGEMIPQFVRRTKPTVVSITKDIDSKDSPSSLATNDYSPDPNSPFRKYQSTQFFGNDRNGITNSITINPNWDTTPPKILWSVPIGAGWASFAVRDGLAVTLEQTSDGMNENVVALRLDDGLPVWVKQLDGSHYRIEGGGGPRTTPVIDGDSVFVLTSNGIVASLNLQNGNKNWEADLLKQSNATKEEFELEVTWGRSGSPLIVDNLLIVPMGGTKDKGRKTITAIDKQTGVMVWTAGTNQVGYASPQLLTIGGVRQIVYVDEMSVSGYRVKDGLRLWSYPWPSHSNGDASVSQASVIDDTSIFISKGYLVGCSRVNIKQNDGVWTASKDWESSKSMKTKFTSCILKDGYSYGLNDGRLECIRLTDGERMWMKGRYGHGQILICGEYLLISSEDGQLVLAAADPNEYRELGKLQVLDGVTWNLPTQADDLILMRNAKAAACIQLPTVLPGN